MDQDTVDSAINCSLKNNKKVPSIEALNSEMPCKENGKDKGKRMLRIFLNRLRLKKCASATISRPDPVYKVAYLGNVVTGWAKEFATIIKDLVGGNSKVEHRAEVIDDPQRRKPDIDRAKRVLNWEPKVSLNSGLHKTVTYFKEELRKLRNSKSFVQEKPPE